MTREEAIELLKGGPDGIAEWNRRRNAREPIPSLGKANLVRANLVRANLCEADLRAADLAGAYLHQADLSGANLCEAKLPFTDLLSANLSGANLKGADLFQARLIGAALRAAHLSGAMLGGADVTQADLTSADLTAATLGWTNLARTELRDATLDNAKVGGTKFADVDLSQVRGLESVKHAFPSTIGVDTLFKSQGKIPEVFLRGCGVPDTLIEHLPRLIGALEPIQFYSCFISYSSKDEDFAHRLHARLQQAKLRVWFSPKAMRGGRKSVRQIDGAIHVYERLLLVLSDHSMQSEWVRHEIKQAREKERREGREVLFPIGLVPFEKIRAWKCLDADTGEDLAEKVRVYHVLDFSQWNDDDAFGAEFAKLMRDLRREDADEKPVS